MTLPFLSALAEALAEHKFRDVSEEGFGAIPDAVGLYPRQTWNTNRAVVVVNPAAVPESFGGYVLEVRSTTAKRCRYIPFFWGIGIQLVVVAPGLARAGIDPKAHVDAIDNQWAIVQSVFLIDPEVGTFQAGRTWGQVLSGRFQDTIERTLAGFYQKQE